MSLYAVAGLPGKIELSVPLYINLVPIGQLNQRPGLPLWKPPKWIQHETANENPGANAAMHNRWLMNGADGQVVSFHFASDDHCHYQNIPINEVTWQAADGNGPGNFQCISNELCVNADGNETKARHNAEELCGQVMKALGQPSSSVGRHWDYNYNNAPSERHHCPDHMMNEGYWPTFVANVDKIIRGGATVPTDPDAPIVYAPGVDSDLCAKWFGSYGPYAFDPDGPVSKVWLSNGLATGNYPELDVVDEYKDSATQTRRYFRFGGLTIFVVTGAAPRILTK